jgi:hypothetical protein
MPAADQHGDHEPNLIRIGHCSLFGIRRIYLGACRKTRALEIRWGIGRKSV